VSGCADGSQPEAGLILDTAGNLYGTTYRGGFENYDGVVFKLTAPPVGTQTQTITFPNPGPLTYGVGSVPLIATASSGLPVYFVILSASPVNVATVTGDTLTVNDAGSVAVQAAQSGNATYAAAAPVTDPITVLPAPLTVVCDNTAVNYGWPIPTTLPVTLTGLVPGDGITATCTTTATQGSPAGPYSIIPTLIDPNGRLSNYSVSSANGTLTIGKQAASIPLILSLSQSTAAAESPGFTLTVTGANFASNAVLLWNGAARKTTPGSSTQLTATVLASDIQNAGTSLVTVINPAPNAGVSAAQPFAVQSSAPTITAASLADTPAAGGDRLLTLTGTNFTPQSTVELKGSTTLASMYLNSWTITALVTPSDYTLLPIVLTVANSSVTSSGFELQ
jgi:hypothetical protein